MTKQEAIQGCLDALRDPTQGVLIEAGAGNFTWAQKGSGIHEDAVAKQYAVVDMAIVLAHTSLASSPEEPKAGDTPPATDTGTDGPTSDGGNQATGQPAADGQ